MNTRPLPDRWWSMTRVTVGLLIVQVALTTLLLGLGIRNLAVSADAARRQSAANAQVLERIEAAIADNATLFQQHNDQVRCVLSVPSELRTQELLDECFGITP